MKLVMLILVVDTFSIDLVGMGRDIYIYVCMYVCNINFELFRRNCIIHFVLKKNFRIFYVYTRTQYDIKEEISFLYSTLNNYPKPTINHEK